MRRPTHCPGIELLPGRLLLSSVTTHHNRVTPVGQLVTEAPAQYRTETLNDGLQARVLTAVSVQATSDLGLGTPVSINTTWAAPTSNTGPQKLTTLVLTTDRGNIDVRTRIYLGSETKVPYTIVGGTGAFAHATGMGTLWQSSPMSADLQDLDVTLSFNKPLAIAILPKGTP